MCRESIGTTQTPSWHSGGISFSIEEMEKLRVVLADEPMGNLDSSTGQEIVALLRNMVKREGKNLIVITHDVRLADVADLRLYIRDGQVTL